MHQEKAYGGSALGMVREVSAPPSGKGRKQKVALTNKDCRVILPEKAIPRFRQRAR